jgi:hypothetical protein
MKDEIEILEKLEKIDKNTTATLATLTAERDTAQVAASMSDEKLEKRKEQNRESQKSYKAVGFKARKEVYKIYEIFAKEEMGASSLSAFLKAHAALLFENRDFQTLFKEFQILQKNDQKHQQVSFFTPQNTFEELEKMAENEGFTLGQLTQNVMLQLFKDKELRFQVVSKINLN